MTIAELESLIEKAQEIQREVVHRLARAPGEMNLLELGGISRLENYHSDVIAFLLNPSAKHRHGEYGKLFLELLKEQGLSIQDCQVVKVEREKSTTTGRRIDIFIETPQEVIILENKVDAGDQAAQMRDYITDCEDRFIPKQVLFVYLTLDGHEMSEDSLKREQKDELLGQNRGVFASYRETILPWLERLTTRITGEEVLSAAIIQYQEAVKGLCNLKEAQKMGVKQFFNHLHSKYEGLERREFQEIYGALENLHQAMEGIHLIKVLSEIFQSLTERYGSGKVYLTIGQRRYADSAEWMENLDIDTTDIGVELSLESGTASPFGLALELSSLDRSANLYFGVMNHGTKGGGPEELLKKLNSDQGWQGHNFRENAYWDAFTRANWARDRIFSLGSIDDKQTSRGLDMVEHIAERWFSEERVRGLMGDREGPKV